MADEKPSQDPKALETSAGTTKDATSRARAGTGAGAAVVSKLNHLQVAEILKPFWSELLQNNVRNVKKILRDNRSKMDFSMARHTASAGGTGLHICAQHGFLACAKLLLDAGVGLDLQNKVGSTALHVACKFQQEELVTFFLEQGARLDVPDILHRVAFDVAPYSVLDSCLLSPLRSIHAKAKQEEARLNEVHCAAQKLFEESKTAKMHASMILADQESHACEEGYALQATSKLDREWSERVQQTKDELRSKQDTYKEHQRLLQLEQDQIVLTWENVFHEVTRRKERAGEQLEQMQLLMEETDQQLAREQQDLFDQCGLLDAAHGFPNDADVQLWVLSMLLAMLDDAESEGSLQTAASGALDVGIDQLLVRDEVVVVLCNVLTRFPTTRVLQFNALHCFLRLVRRCISAVGKDPRFSAFLVAVLKADVMAASRDALTRFDQDVHLAHVVFELLFHLLQVRGAGSTHGLRFCQNRRSHVMPLQLFHLHEIVLQSQDCGLRDAAKYECVSSSDVLAARHHASFLLFTLVQYNVRAALVKKGVVSVVSRLILELASAPSCEATSVENDIKAETLQYFLGSLALVLSPPVSRAEGELKLSPRPATWSVDALRQLLNALQPWIMRPSSSKTHSSLVFWTLKLLRHLTWADGPETANLRTELRDVDTFELLAEVVLAVRARGCIVAGGQSVVVWLELLADVWLGSVDRDGRLDATVAYVLEFIVRLLDLEAQLLDSQESKLASSETTARELTAVLGLTTRVLSNDKNMRFMAVHAPRVDAAVRAILLWLVSSPGCDVQLDAVLEVLAHILRMYLHFFDSAAKQACVSASECHARCQKLGICDALRAFKISDAAVKSRGEHGTGASKSLPISSTNQATEKTEKTSSKLKTKTEIAQAWTRSDDRKHVHEAPSQWNAITALARALRRHAPCTCDLTH